MATCPTNGSRTELLSRLGNSDEKPSLVTADVCSENNRDECFELTETSAAPNGSESRRFEESSPSDEGCGEILNDLNVVSPSGALVDGMNVVDDEIYRELEGSLDNGDPGKCRFSTLDLPETAKPHDPPQNLDRCCKNEAATNGYDKIAAEAPLNTDLNSNFHVNGMNADETHALTSGLHDLVGQVPAQLDFKENYFETDKYSSQSSSLSSVVMGTGGHGNGCYCNTSGNDSSSALHYSDQSSVSSEIICHSPMCSCRLCYESQNHDRNYGCHSDASSGDHTPYNYESETDKMNAQDTNMAESSFIEIPPRQIETNIPPLSPLTDADANLGRSVPAINGCYPSLDPMASEIRKQLVQAEVHLSVMSLPGADSGTPTELLPSGSIRSLTRQTCARFDEREHNAFCNECGCERPRSSIDVSRPTVKVVSHPAYDGRLPNPTQVVFNTLQQSLAQDRLEKKKRAMHLALRSRAAPLAAAGAEGHTGMDAAENRTGHSRMHTMIAQSIDAMYRSHPMQIHPVLISGAQMNNVMHPQGMPANLSTVLAGGGSASLQSPITSTPQGNTPAAGVCHSLMTPISPAACLAGSAINESSLQWAVAGGTALNGELSSLQQAVVPVSGPGVTSPMEGDGGLESLARSTETLNAIGGFDWRARRMMDVARNSIRGAAARLMMKLHLAGQKPLAPPLNDNLQYHVFFLYHHNDRDWVLSVMEKLESPTLGFKTCCHERDFDARTTLTQSTHYGIKNSLKTVIILSPEFVSDTWNHADMQLLSEMDVILIQKDLIVILLQECDIPHILTDTAYIDANQEDWWSKLLSGLCSSDDTPMTEETNLSLSSSLVGLNPNLQSGHLLLSIKSQCRVCGKEVVDPTEVPDDLLAHGIQITPDEYHEAVSYLMSDNKFRCHVWCYNVPAAMLFFTLFLGLCLAVIPLVEARLIFHGAETGLEFVHGGIVWLCALTLYMVIIHISKRKMKDNTYKKLTFVNTILIKYNLLAGVENLGLADCNKYYLHFFYFEMGPCLAYLQELMVNMEEYSTCFQNQIAESGDVAVEIECEEDHVTSSNDRSRVLDRSTITNTTMQAQAEDLILGHSGEYINLLITKKLERPRRQRHVRDAPCLCQYVEQRVYKMIV